MTEQEWKTIEGKLQGAYGMVKIQADDHVITLAVERLKGLQYCIMVYIDGWIKGEYLNKDSALGLKYYRKVERYLYTKKKRDDAAKFRKKFKDKDFLSHADDKYTYLVLWFLSFKSVKKQLLENCKQNSLKNRRTPRLLMTQILKR